MESNNKPKTLKLNNEILESMFYDIRNEKVMLDLDLAAIFGYETKNLNRMVKNNIDSFDENVFFHLNNMDLKCQNVTANVTAIFPSRCKFFTLNSSRGSNIKYMPYAFTVEGINILINILKPKNEIAQNNVMLLMKYINKNIEKWPSEANNYEIVKFESGNIMLDVRVSPNEDTIWLTQNEIAILFDTTIPNINMHLTNIFEEKELSKNSVVKKSLITAADGKSYNTMLYNLDAVISIGFRVNTKRGIEFRRWANSILKNYLIKGYSINTKRCLEHSDIINTLLKQVNELSNTSKRLDSIEKKVDIVMNYFNDPKTHRHYALFKGNRIESDVAYQTIYKLAKKSIYIIDDYIDVKTLQLLKCIESNINIIIFSDNKGSNSLNQIYINDFIKDTGINIIIKQNKKTFHSRYIIIDYMTNNYQIYLCGGSSKDGGTSTNTIIELEEKEVYSSLINKVLSYDKTKIF